MFLALLCSSCELSTVRLFHVERGEFTPAEVEALREAAARWEAFAPVVVRILESPIEGGTDQGLIWRAAIPGFDGLATLGKPFIRYRHGVTVTLPLGLHEIGHTLGLDHAGVGVMTALPGPGSEWTADDLEECERVGVCDD